MEINRRHFCQLLSSALLLPQLCMAHDTKPLFASSAKDSAGKYHLYLIGEQGQVMLDHLLPARAHHTEVHPQQPLLACVARRPGTFIDIINYQDKRLVKRIIADQGYHFFGHSIFSADGKHLITTENQISTGQGRIVIRALEKHYKVIADYPSYGIGPHELVLQPKSDTLVVANGGILTHPDRGREKLNLESMQPSLLRLDLTNGERQEQLFFPNELHQLSIRHLDVNAQGKAVIALQHQGDTRLNLPLVATQQPGEAIQLHSAPQQTNMKMKGYCGSTRFDSSGRFAAVSAPRGDLISFWNMQKNSFHSAIKSRDGCGLAATGNDGEFMISSGTGRCSLHNVYSGETVSLPLQLNVSWDNHLAGLSG